MLVKQLEGEIDGLIDRFAEGERVITVRAESSGGRVQGEDRLFVVVDGEFRLHHMLHTIRTLIGARIVQ